MTDATTFTKEDTVALWHAVQWMADVVREWHGEGFESDRAREQYEIELSRLIAAKRALRKANAIRKAQSRRPRNAGASPQETA